MSAIDRAVREQYEALPYPARDPRDEAKRLILGSPSHLAEIDHHLFAGGRAWDRPMRVLVAGGGTGDATVMLAQQLHDAGRPHEIVHLDPSAAARQIAGARLAVRGLTSLQLVDGAIEALPTLGLGLFDYIDCCGVLHHLADPAVGIAALAAVLAPGGGCGVMVYGRFGRAGLYEVQDALRTLVPEGPPLQRVAAARRVVASLPPDHPFRRNRNLIDHQSGDAGFFDLLLHPRDRAYSVPELLDLLAGAGLAATAFVEPLRYDPTAWLTHPEPRARAAALPPSEQWALAEQLSGAMPRHIVYTGRPGEVATAAPAPTLIPCWRTPPTAAERAGLVAELNQGSLTADDGVVRLVQPMPRGAGAVADRIDGQRTVAALIADLAIKAAKDVALETLRRLVAANLVLFRGTPTLAPPVPTGFGGRDAVP